MNWYVFFSTLGVYVLCTFGVVGGIWALSTVLSRIERRYGYDAAWCAFLGGMLLVGGVVVAYIRGMGI